MIRIFWIAIGLPVLTAAASNYKVERTSDHGVEIIRLTDISRQTSVSIVPSAGNRAYEFTVHGRNVLYFPFPDVAAFKTSPRPSLNGIPFLAPWANRIPDGGFWWQDLRYLFNPGLNTARVDKQGIASHGMLTTSALWQVEDAAVDERSAHVTAKLAFWKYPQLMANWAFAHEYEMTYRLANGVLEVTTKVTNLSASDMPLSIGYHPYFQISGVPRAEWTVHIPARQHVETDSRLVATGQLTDRQLPEQISLRDQNFDDGFTSLIRDAKGTATFSVAADGRKIEVEYGPQFRVAVVYAPPGQNFICFEPMTAITNGINLAHEGKYAELQTVKAGSSWLESFRVKPTGF